MKKNIAIVLLVCSLSSLTLSNQAFADGPKVPPGKPDNPGKSNDPGKPDKPGKPDNPGKPGGNPGHKDAPFDAGLTLLIGAGVIYGLKKAYDNRHQGA